MPRDVDLSEDVYRIGVVVLIALCALLVSVMAIRGARAWCQGCGDSYGWTLYTFVRYPPGAGAEFIRDPDGFLQQELSSHRTLEACVDAFHDPTRYHQAPVESGRCIYVNNSFPTVELRPRSR